MRYTRGCDLTDARWPENELPELPSEHELAEIHTARRMAKEADVAIVVVGDDERLVGESKSRTSLDLPGYQLAWSGGRLDGHPYGGGSRERPADDHQLDRPQRPGDP